MYRIDENTYIDDTLITCGEYQLFIDEMRAQGEYHQPDHWTSYQFPAGQGREPVLGVRHSDAEAFCKWLSGREKGEWLYRLPSAAEAAACPLKTYKISPLGYWLASKTDDERFTWNGPVLSNPRNFALTRDLIHNHAIDFDLVRKRVVGFEFVQASDLAHAINRAIDLAQNRYIAFVRDLDIARVRDLELALARASALDIARVRQCDLDLARDIGHARTLARDLARARVRVREIDHSLDLTIIRATGHAQDLTLGLNLNLARTLARDLGRALALALARARNRAKNRVRDLMLSRDLARDLIVCNEIISLISRRILRYSSDDLDIYIDLFTLQERIAGRSPAFEGIRMVKERKPANETTPNRQVFSAI